MMSFNLKVFACTGAKKYEFNRNGTSNLIVSWVSDMWYDSFKMLGITL